MATVQYLHTTGIGERLDQICVNRYGSSKNDVVVYVLDQNPGLEDQGIVLDIGTVIHLPDLPITATTQTVRTQTLLWE